MPAPMRRNRLSRRLPGSKPGAPLPHPADTVLALDAVATVGGAAQAVGTAARGDDVLGAGADAGFGRLLRHGGERLRDIDVAVLRAAGIPRVQVREPRVRIFSSNPRIDAVDDTVGPLIARAVEACGGVTMVERATPDGEWALADALRAEDADAVIVIGGTGTWRHDRSVLTLAGIGRLDMHGLGIRPGETAALGGVGSRPVLLLPGRLDAALAVWLVVGRRLLALLTGWHGSEPIAKEKLARKIASTIGVAEVVPVRRGEAGLEPLASGYFPISALAAADGWVLVSPESEGYPAGSVVEMRPLP